MKKRVGNDIKMTWTILRSGEAEVFDNATNIKIYAYQINTSTSNIEVDFVRNSNVFSLNIPAESLNVGTYDLRLTYNKPDSDIEGGLGSYAIDEHEAFQIVKHTEAEDATGTDITGEVVYYHSSYVYIASASDTAGANFNYPANISQDYLAILNVTTEIPTPVVGDFEGLWFSKIDAYRAAQIGGYTGTMEQFYLDLVSVHGLSDIIEDAIAATTAANDAATLANQKATLANEAAILANTKANLSDEKANLADQKATEANNAANSANGAAMAANQATNNAIEATESISETEQTVQVNEALRVEAEGDATKGRVKAENDRVAAEALRQQQEDARESAETARNVASNMYNVTLAVPLTAGSYYTATTARAAVPSGVRKRGLELVYETSAGVWYCERFIGASVTTWTTSTDWEIVPTKKYVDDADALKVNKSDIANNLTETAEGKVLDARQGKVLNDILTKMNENWVGVIVDPSLSCSEPAPKSTVVAYRATELKRTGNLEFHKFEKSRIFNSFYPAIVIRATKEIAWKLDKSDFTKKEDGSASTPDWTIHNICIVIPDLYRRIVLLDGTQDGKYEIRYDIVPFEGATLFHEESYHSISDVQVDRTLTQLVSVISDDVRFRGGNNDATRDSQAWRTQLGMPATKLSRISFETYADNAGWETMNIYDWTLFSELAMLYFANTNIQLDYTSVLTAEGYPQGGLGAGNTTWISKRWSDKNSYYPLDKVGEGSMSIGCKVGVKTKTVTNYYIGSVTSVAASKCVSTANFSAGNGWLASYIGYTLRNLTTNATATITAKDDDNTLSLSDDIFTAVGQIFHIEGVTFTYGVPVFFGLENLYGHLWKHCSGINIMIQSADAGGRSMAYVNPDWATRSNTEITSNYEYVGDIPRADGYIKTLYPGWNIPKLSTGAGSNSFMSDYFYTSIPASGSSLRCIVVSAGALFGERAGLRFVDSFSQPSAEDSNIGARLRAKKPKNE